MGSPAAVQGEEGTHEVARREVIGEVVLEVRRAVTGRELRLLLVPQRPRARIAQLNTLHRDHAISVEP